MLLFHLLMTNEFKLTNVFTNIARIIFTFHVFHYITKLLIRISFIDLFLWGNINGVQVISYCMETPFEPQYNPISKTEQLTKVTMVCHGKEEMDNIIYEQTKCPCLFSTYVMLSPQKIPQRGIHGPGLFFSTHRQYLNL